MVGRRKWSGSGSGHLSGRSLTHGQKVLCYVSPTNTVYSIKYSFCGQFISELWCVYNDRDTGTDWDRQKMACTELHEGVHAAQRQRLMQISIEFCIHFIGICVGLGVRLIRLTSKKEYTLLLWAAFCFQSLCNQ